MLYEWKSGGCSVVKYLRRARRHFSPVSTTINWSRMPEAAHRPGLQGVRAQFDAVVSLIRRKLEKWSPRRKTGNPENKEMLMAQH